MGPYATAAIIKALGQGSPGNQLGAQKAYGVAARFPLEFWIMRSSTASDTPPGPLHRTRVTTAAPPLAEAASPTRLPSIGFVLVTYNLPEQTVYLCRKLSDMFGDPPIAVHHDYGQSYLDERKLPGNVRVVQAWRRTAWGIFPVVEANLDALRLLYSFADPDWTVSLSNADYPIKLAEEILTDLASSKCDALLDHRELRPPALPGTHLRDEAKAFADPAWLEVAYNRYVATDLTPRHLVWRFPSLHRPRLLRSRLAERLFTPFRANFRPYGGDSWYTVNRRAAAALTSEDKHFQEIRRWYRDRRVPEESAYHTILCNRADLSISPDNRRYTDWAQGGPSPRLLTRADIAALLHTPAHFARKFAFEPFVFELLDRAVESFAPERE